MRGRQPAEGGSGVLSMSFAVMAFLGFLFFAVQLSFNLYATSVVNGAAHQAAQHVARSVADAPPEHVGAVQREAAAIAQAEMGRYAERMQVSIGFEGDNVVVSITGRNPNFMFNLVPGSLPLTRVDRTAKVRVERFQCWPAC